MMSFQHYYLIFKGWLSSIRSTTSTTVRLLRWLLHQWYKISCFIEKSSRYYEPICIYPDHTCSFLFGPWLFLVSYLFVHSCRYCYSDLAQASFIFTIFLPIPTQCWDCMCIPLNLIIVVLMITMFSYVKYLNSPFSEIIYIYFTTWKKLMSLSKSKID